MATASLDEAKTSIPSEVEYETSVLIGEPAEVLVEAAADRGAILVLGSRAYGPIRRVRFGLGSSAVMRSARCPVLVHPRGVPVDDGATEPAGPRSAP